MSNQSIKVVRPWPAEQPRPPMVIHGVRNTDSARSATTERLPSRVQDRATSSTS